MKATLHQKFSAIYAQKFTKEQDILISYYQDKWFSPVRLIYINQNLNLFFSLSFFVYQKFKDKWFKQSNSRQLILFVYSLPIWYMALIQVILVSFFFFLIILMYLSLIIIIFVIDRCPYGMCSYGPCSLLENHELQSKGPWFY